MTNTNTREANDTQGKGGSMSKLESLLRSFRYYDPDELGEDAFKELGDDEIKEVLDAIAEELPDEKELVAQTPGDIDTFQHNQLAIGFNDAITEIKENLGID